MKPLDPNIIASVNMNYRRRDLERAADLSKTGVNDIYEVDILTAMT